MESTMLTKIKSALVSGGIAIVMAVGGYIISLGDVFAVDPHALVNAAVMAFVVSITSFIKSYFTKEDGTFGGVKVK